VQLTEFANADPVVDHAVTSRPHEIGGRRVGNVQLIKIDDLLNAILRRHEKPQATWERNRGNSNKEASELSCANILAIPTMLYTPHNPCSLLWQFLNAQKIKAPLEL